jgi:hypothetical protein
MTPKTLKGHNLVLSQTTLGMKINIYLTKCITIISCSALSLKKQYFWLLFDKKVRTFQIFKFPVVLILSRKDYIL